MSAGESRRAGRGSLCLLGQTSTGDLSGVYSTPHPEHADSIQPIPYDIQQDKPIYTDDGWPL